MCGISGILEFNQGKMVSKKFLAAMNQRLVHRGPDDEGVYCQGRVGLANRRLSIIDLDFGHQPIHNEDKTCWLVFNGEIYNFFDLRKDLLKKGHRFYTQSDTETVLHLYEEKGEKCVGKLDGMFAFAIWDKKKKQLLLARDRLGKKPLYWTVFKNKFVFASEMKAILTHPEFEKKLDRQSLAKYFFYGFIPAPATIFKGIKKLLPGYTLKVKNGQVFEKKYWEIDYSLRTEKTLPEIKSQIVELLKKAVKKRLMADVSLGVFLSGGIDSSLITAMMAQMMSPSQIQAFSIGFKEKAADESISAKRVAKSLGVNHYLKIFSAKEAANLIPKIADFLDEPIADPSILPTYFLSLFAQKEIKVALSGDGGDESFAGYPKYLGHWFLEKTRLTKLPLHYLERFFSGKAKKFCQYSHYPLPLRNQLWISPFSFGEVEKLIGEKVNPEEIDSYHRLFNGQNSLEEAFFLDQKLTLADLYLPKLDRASMAASLEIRCPFLDKKIVELSAQIPFGVKLKGGKTKSLLKEIALEFLPPEVVFQPKRGFGVPLTKWLRGSLASLVLKEFKQQKIKKEGILNPQLVQFALEAGDSQQIWTLFIFELWLKKWLKS